jgi:hypothetical protein
MKGKIIHLGSMKKTHYIKANQKARRGKDEGILHRDVPHKTLKSYKRKRIDIRNIDDFNDFRA